MFHLRVLGYLSDADNGPESRIERCLISFVKSKYTCCVGDKVCMMDHGLRKKV
jgi:hypothetical protein